VVHNWAFPPPTDRYGPVTFVVAQVHIFIVGLLMWLLIPYSVVLVLPAVLVYMAISALIAMNQRKLGQVGRGMLIGSASAPLSAILFGLVLVIAKAIGPI
jgi:hypothetical protein